MVRLNTRWNKPQHKCNLQNSGKAMAVNLWKIAADGLLQIENEGFETTTLTQRLDVVVELLAYLLHMLDRIAYERSDDATRTALVAATAQKLIDLVANNYADIGITGYCRETFVRLLNARGDDYADCGFYNGAPGFTLRRLFGESVQKVLGKKDRQWVPDYVLDVIAPKMYTDLRRVVRQLFPA